MYDFEWHKAHGDKTYSSAVAVVSRLMQFHPARSVLDIGCGDGRWLAASAELGATEIAGVDGPWTDKSRLLIPTEALTVQDLSEPVDLQRRFDLAMSLEVAEHVEEVFAKTFVESLVRHSDFVLFGAAIPYQGGFRHVNERWQSYWKEIFAELGYVALDPFRAQIWDSPDVHYWYKQNMLVYVNQTRQDLIENVRTYMLNNAISALPVDVVHPEKFEDIATYRQIAFKPLLRELPRQTLAKLRAVALGQT